MRSPVKKKQSEAKDNTPPVSPTNRGNRWMRGIFREIIFPVFMAIIVIQFVIQAFRIPSGSMEDSLLVGDFLLGLKFAYGSPMPFSDNKLPGYTSPDTGDIIIFRYPGEPEYPDYDKERYTHLANLLMFGNFYWDHEAPEDSPSLVHFPDGPKDFIKRAVAKSGQTIAIKDGELIVDGKLKPLPGKGKYLASTRGDRVRDEMRPVQLPSPGDTLDLNAPDIEQLYRLKSLILQENPDRIVEFDLQMKLNGEPVKDYVFSDYVIEGQSHPGAMFSRLRWFARKTFMPQPYPEGSLVRRVGYQFFDLAQLRYFIQNVEMENKRILQLETTRAIAAGITDTTILDSIASQEPPLQLSAKILMDGESLDTYLVKDHCFFMMGDNRDNSSDSRYWGFLSNKNIKAKAFLIYFSYDTQSSNLQLFNPFSWFEIPFHIRWSRIGKLIHGV